MKKIRAWVNAHPRFSVLASALTMLVAFAGAVSYRTVILMQSSTSWQAATGNDPAYATQAGPWMLNGHPIYHTLQSGVQADWQFGDLTYSVIPFGAACNGTADDSTAVANALTAIGSTPNATLLVPSGCQLKTTGINVQNITGLRIRGEGAMLIGSVEANPVIQLNNCTHCEISGFSQIKHATTSGRNSTGEGILVLNSTDVKVDHNFVGPVCGVGIMVHGTSAIVTAESNYVTGSLADGISAAYGATDVSFLGNHIKDTGDDGISVVGYNNIGVVNKRVAISGNTVEFSGANNSHGITVAGADGVSVTGNVVNGSHFSGIAVTSTAAFNIISTSNVQIAGNTTTNVLIEAGIYVWADNATNPITNVNITGNTTKNTPNAGVRVWGTVANAVFSVAAEGNKIYTTTGDDGIAYLGVVEGSVFGNDIYNAWDFGVDINSNCVNISSGWNNIYKPNQSNGASNYGSYNASAGSQISPDYIVQDGTKAALLLQPSVQIGNAYNNGMTLMSGAASGGVGIVLDTINAFSGGVGVHFFRSAGVNLDYFDSGGNLFMKTGGIDTIGGAVGVTLCGANCSGITIGRGAIGTAVPGSIGFNGGVTASGATAVNFGGSTGDFTASTGNLSWAGASGKTASLTTTAATLSLTAGAASTWDSDNGTVRGATFDATTATGVSICPNNATSCGIGNAGHSTNLFGTTVINAGLRKDKTNVADTGVTLSNTNLMAAYTSISAARVVTVSCTFGSAAAPEQWEVKDESGSASGTNTITITPSSGTIDGAASKVCVNSAYGFCHFYSNGTNCFLN